MRTHHHPASGQRGGRQHCELRNELWSTWLRRPLWPALGAAAAGLPWVLRERRVVPPRVEEAVKLLQEQSR